MTFLHVSHGDEYAREHLESNGYIVIARTDLPAVTAQGEKPRLPAGWGEATNRNPPTSAEKATLFREDALGKLALAAWYDAEQTRTDKRLEKLTADIQTAPWTGTQTIGANVAAHLIKKGWHQ